MANVILKNISKTYNGGKIAVQNVNLEIKDKEFVVLVGPSGCGKTTTLRMIAGLEEITGGELFIDSELMNDIPPKERDIAMVFQNYALYPHMTVFENMSFGLKLRKFSKQEIKARVETAAEILEITDLLNRKPKQLSGGQRQRVAVGRAIVRQPKVFLFDEPLSNLDAKLRVQMRTEIAKLHQKLDATMVYVTHDQTEAMTLGDRIVVMKDGVVQQIDTPLNVYKNPVNKFVAGFIGSPAMNFISGCIVDEAGAQFVSDQKTLQVNAAGEKPGGNIVLGIRPEDISYINIPNSAEIEIELEVLEPMGNEILGYFSVEGNKFVARFDNAFSGRVGEKIKAYLNTESLHFFREN